MSIFRIYFIFLCLLLLDFPIFSLLLGMVDGWVLRRVGCNEFGLSAPPPSWVRIKNRPSFRSAWQQNRISSFVLRCFAALGILINQSDSWDSQKRSFRLRRRRWEVLVRLKGFPVQRQTAGTKSIKYAMIYFPSGRSSGGRCREIRSTVPQKVDARY